MMHDFLACPVLPSRNFQLLLLVIVLQTLNKLFRFPSNTFVARTCVHSRWATTTASSSTESGASTRTLKPLGPRFRGELLDSIGIKSHVPEYGALGYDELDRIAGILNATDKNNLKKSRAFLQVLADHDLL